MHVRIYTDGGARGNPGPAASGAVIKTLNAAGEEGSTVASLKEFLGKTTNNQAEYYAIILGLTKAKELGAKRVELVMDSELAVKQLNGHYRVKHPEIAKKFLQVKNLMQSFREVRVRHIRREGNREADALVNQALDERM